MKCSFIPLHIQVVQDQKPLSINYSRHYNLDQNYKVGTENDQGK